MKADKDILEKFLSLTPREKEAFRLYASGYSRSEIARMLPIKKRTCNTRGEHVGVRTVEAYLAHTQHKLGVKGFMLIPYFLKYGEMFGFRPIKPFRLADSELTDREMDVLRLIAQGKTDIEVGEELSIGKVSGLSNRAVNRIRARIFEKLGVGNVREAIRYAFQFGLAEMPCC